MPGREAPTIANRDHHVFFVRAKRQVSSQGPCRQMDLNPGYLDEPKNAGTANIIAKQYLSDIDPARRHRRHALWRKVGQKLTGR